MDEFIFDTRKQISIINLELTQQHLSAAASKVEDICSKGNKILFVGTKRSASKTVKEGDLVLEMPESLIVSTRSAQKSALAPVLSLFYKPSALAASSSKSPASNASVKRQSTGELEHSLTSHEVLCMILIHERFLGDKSSIAPFIASLPPSYPTPFYWTEDDIQYLWPRSRQSIVEDDKAKIRTIRDNLRPAMSQFHHL